MRKKNKKYAKKILPRVVEKVNQFYDIGCCSLVSAFYPFMIGDRKPNNVSVSLKKGD